jgi:hypothetical protein
MAADRLGALYRLFHWSNATMTIAAPCCDDSLPHEWWVVIRHIKGGSQAGQRKSWRGWDLAGRF